MTHLKKNHNVSMSLVFIPCCIKIKTLTLKTTLVLYEKNFCFLGNIPQTFKSKKKISCHVLPLAALQKHTQAWRAANSGSADYRANNGWSADYRTDNGRSADYRTDNGRSADRDMTFLALLWKPFCGFFIRGKSKTSLPSHPTPRPSYFKSSIFQGICHTA